MYVTQLCFRARNRASGPDPGWIRRESLKLGPRPAEGQPEGRFVKLCRLESGRNAPRKPDFGPGNTIAEHKIKHSSEVE